MIKITYVLSTFFRNSDRKICDMFDFIAENSTNKGDFPKLSTGEIPVSTGLIDFLNQFGPVSIWPNWFQHCTNVKDT